MQNKFQNKYRIPSSRLQTWDYGTNGAYFITICTQSREHFFGVVQNGTMQLSETGKIAEQLWIEIPNQFPFIELGNFVVMPNHVHGILIINKIVSPSVETRFIASKNIESIDIKETRFIASKNIESIDNKETRLIASLPNKNGGFSGDKNPMLNDTISKIIRWYKGRCTFECRKINSDFSWQSRFHDHIIRNSKSFDIIQNYIFENPMNWEKDKFYNQ
ncbi:transposase [Flavobacterium sp.]|jgi:REP element-mobilizing transposase RayT|uniref:transposase n=1 Tax=Flavobacterium sp. TaxID=239 RepID=UPI0037BF1772